MNKYIYLGVILLIPGSLLAAEGSRVPRDSNYNNTGGYDGTRVEAQLVMMVSDETKKVHFIRDNNDPRVVTKTYLLKNVDPYDFRDYLRQMVQAKRVGNTSLQQQFPGNTSNPPSANNPAVNTNNPNVATTSSVVPTTPATAQPTYTPTLQLGSNTAVECMKYADGTGLLIVSAEEYRFKDHENGMGIDSLVEFMDQPTMGASNGGQVFLYLPKFVPAMNLVPLIQNVGMNINDATELWQGEDLVVYDPDLNWLIFDVANYSCDNISEMLAKYDVPTPQVRLRITVYEVYRENDEKIGMDFLAWKNNDGVTFFQGGGRYRNNWAAAYGLGGLNKTLGSERTSYFNFNPKWSSRYLDFLTTTGHAKIAHTGELVIRNNTSASFARTTQIFYDDVSQPVTGSTTTPDLGVGPYQLLSQLLAAAGVNADANIPIGKGEMQTITKATGFGFTMMVNNASVNLNETRMNITLNNTSLIGFNSSGAPRISSNNSVNVDISLPHTKDSFAIGSLRKQETVKSRTGVPWLCDIPLLGYLFSTKSTSVKHAELIVMAQCEYESPAAKPWTGMSTKHKKP